MGNDFIGGTGFIGGKTDGGSVSNAGGFGVSPSGDYYVWTGVRITWMPSPESDLPIGGLCGTGMQSSIALCLVEQASEQATSAAECKNEVMKHCAMAQCPPEQMTSLCGSGGGFNAGGLNLTAFPHYGLIDPSPEADTSGTPKGNPCQADPFGTPMTPKQKQACCAEKPFDPICIGDGGGNPLYHQDGLAAQPGSLMKGKGGLMRNVIRALFGKQPSTP